MKMEDVTTKYNRLIAPKVKEIINICNENKIPCFMAFATKEETEGRLHLECSSLIPEMFRMHSDKDTRFADFINVQNGFTAVPKITEDHLSMQELGLPTGFGKFDDAESDETAESDTEASDDKQ